MKSHSTEFDLRDLARTVAAPVATAATLVLLLHLAARAGALPSPRPTLDTDRTILVHQVDAARREPAADVVLIGDSSCLMDVSAAHLGARLQQSALNLGTLSYLDPAAYGRLLSEFTRRHAPKEIVLLMHPEALRRSESEAHHRLVLDHYLDGIDDSRPGSAQDAFNTWAGVTLVQGRLLARWLPTPLRGVYGAYYGFSRDLEVFMTRQRGSAVDPGHEKIAGPAEYRLASTLERHSQALRAAVPPTCRLRVGLTPIPAGIAPPDFERQRNTLLEEWSRWLGPVTLLTNLPATLPNDAFARTTHLRPSAVTNYTEVLAAALTSSR